VFSEKTQKTDAEVVQQSAAFLARKMRCENCSFTMLGLETVTVSQQFRMGWANRLVADEMEIGGRIVDKYRSDVFETLWVNDPTELDRLMRNYAID
jgi:DNA-binding NarL/FixJ family response regulator